MVLIFGLIVIGIILLVLEIIVLPGLIAGIIGGILITGGIFLMYSQYGTLAGHLTLLGTGLLTFFALYSSLKSKSWKRFGLKETIEGKMNDLSSLQIQVGDEGICLSALRPSGTIIINDVKIEAQTNGEMIDAGTKVVVTKVLQNKVVVKSE